MRALLLHGFSGSPSSFDEVVHALPRHAHLLRPAISGHAGNHTIATSFDAEVARLATYARVEGAGPLLVVGYSLGARLGLALALQHPTLVERLILVGASPGIEGAAERHARAMADDALAGLLRDEGLEAFVDRWEALPVFQTQRSLPTALRARKRAERLSHDPDALSAALCALSKGRMPSYWDRLGELRVPVDLVVGGLDEPFAKIADQMARRLSQVTVHVVDGAGHDVLLERPSALAALMLSGVSP